APSPPRPSFNGNSSLDRGCRGLPRRRATCPEAVIGTVVDRDKLGAAAIVERPDVDAPPADRLTGGLALFAGQNHAVVVVGDNVDDVQPQRLGVHLRHLSEESDDRLLALVLPCERTETRVPW